MGAEARQRLVGALLLTFAMGIFGTAVMGWPAGLLVAGCVFVSLVVAKNL